MTSHGPPSIFRQKNLKWVLVCIILGTGVFLLWPGSNFIETDIFVPVEPGEIPEGLTLSGPPLKGLDVRIRGPKSSIETLSDLKLKYPIDLSNVKVGVNAISIDPERIPFPKAVTVMQASPTFLTVRVDKEIKKEVPVTIAFSGKPASGFFIADALAKPSSVTLRGPENLLAGMERVFTKPVDVKGLSESFKKEIALDLAEGLDIISSSRIIVSEIFIEEEIVTKKFDHIVVQGKETPYTYSITPPEISIEVKGPVNILEQLKTKNSIKVYVDLKTLTPGVYVRRAAISLPIKTTLVNVEPEIFTVTIGNRVRTPEVVKEKKE